MLKQLFVVKSKAGNGLYRVIKEMELLKMFDSNRCQKLFVSYKYKLIVSVMVLMALDALLIKGFIDMFTATLNGSFLVLTVAALFTVGYYRKKYHYYKVLVYGEEEFTEMVTVTHY